MLLMLMFLMVLMVLNDDGHARGQENQSSSRFKVLYVARSKLNWQATWFLIVSDERMLPWFRSDRCIVKERGRSTTFWDTARRCTATVRAAAEMADEAAIVVEPDSEASGSGFDPRPKRI